MHARRLLVLPLALLAASAATAQPTHNDVVYATVGTGSLRMDIYRPPNQQPHAPCMLFIHGGGWSGGTHDAVPVGLQSLLQNGFVVASIGYRLTSQEGQFGPGVPVTFPAQIHDVKGAVRYLRAHAFDYGVDPARFACWGTSAGGHLSALLATSGGVGAAEGVTGGNAGYSSRVQAAVDYFGPIDLLQMNPDVTTPPGSTIDHDAPNSPESRLLGWDEPGQGVGDIRNNIGNPNPPYPMLLGLAALCSPAVHVDPADPPIYIAHGLDDTSVPSGQSVRLGAALAGAGVEHTLRLVPGAGHGFLGAETNNQALAFIVDALSPCPGDIDGDREVGFPDLNAVLGDFGLASAPGASRPGDADGDGVVGFADLNLVLSAYGFSCR